MDLFLLDLYFESKFRGDESEITNISKCYTKLLANPKNNHKSSGSVGYKPVKNSKNLKNMILRIFMIFVKLFIYFSIEWTIT